MDTWASSAPPPDRAASLGAAFARFGDVALAVMALVVVALIVLPMPPWTLDLLIALNLALGVLLMLFALYVPTPLAFSTFPSVLLFTTLFRVALNVATTRQILLHADGGRIIDAFGNYVVAGSLLVGLVVFFIITVVQFVVVAKGAERVAEVGARFTLDALPGKQLAIDADLRAGLITQAEALRQRERLSLESQFFGSMDGAMKFVKGDAIAGIVIVFVNLLGGIAMGMLVMGMSASEAGSRFAVLSIGDGLVSQIPALFIALAAGIVVTRTAGQAQQNLAQQIGAQLATQPRALLLAGGAIALMGLVPGLPALPFVAVGGGGLLLAWITADRQRRVADSGRSRQIHHAGREGEAGPVVIQEAAQAGYSALAVVLPTALVQRLVPTDLGHELGLLREQLRMGLGLPFPGLSVRRSRAETLDRPVLLLMETAVGSVQLEDGDDSRQIARRIALALHQLIERYAHELVGVQETRWLLSQVERRYPDLVREALGLMPLPALANLLAALVADGVPLRDMRGVLEAVVDHAGHQPPLSTLVERVREACSRALSSALLSADGSVALRPLQPALEERLREQALPPSADGVTQFPFELIEQLATEVRRVQAGDTASRVVLLAASALRAGLQRQLRVYLPNLVVLAPGEISAAYPLRSLPALALHDADASEPIQAKE